MYVLVHREVGLVHSRVAVSIWGRLQLSGGGYCCWPWWHGRLHPRQVAGSQRSGGEAHHPASTAYLKRKGEDIQSYKYYANLFFLIHVLKINFKQKNSYSIMYNQSANIIREIFRNVHMSHRGFKILSNHSKYSTYLHPGVENWSRLLSSDWGSSPTWPWCCPETDSPSSSYRSQPPPWPGDQRCAGTGTHPHT